MVSRRVDGAHPVRASRETRRNVSANNSALGRSVQTLEERKGVRVRHGRLGERAEELDGNVSVADDSPRTVNLCMNRQY